MELAELVARVATQLLDEEIERLLSRTWVFHTS